MRVLLLCHGLPPESVGGVEQHVAGLAPALAELGASVQIYARTGAGDAAQATVSVQCGGNPAIHRVAYRWQGLRGLDDLYAVPALDGALRNFLRAATARGERFDVAHVHHLTGMSTGCLHVLAEAGIPVVLTLHDYWLACPRGQMFHHRQEVCERLDAARCGECLQSTFPGWLRADNATAAAAALHRRAGELLALPQRLVVPSPRALPPFLQLGIARERFSVVENGVDTEALSSLPPAPCGPGPLRLGYLGTLIPSKGLHVLVDALLLQRPGTARLDIFGNAVPYHGDETYLTRVFSRLPPGAPIAYHGPYLAADLPQILQQVDVVAAPALWHEAFGLTVREGLAAGRAAIVSRIGGLQDAVADGVQGHVVPAGDVAALAAAIAAMAADRPRTRAMAAAGRPAARSFRAMAEDLLAIYQTVRSQPRA